MRRSIGVNWDDAFVRILIDGGPSRILAGCTQDDKFLPNGSLADGDATSPTRIMRNSRQGLVTSIMLSSEARSMSLL
jgi:hypothetical protein